MTFPEILKSLKQKQYKPLYFLHGDEAYFIDVISDYIENEVLNEGERAFNQTIVYGKDVDHLAIVDTARRYPMMAQHQVLILKEAQDMKTLKDLQTYVEKPLDSTILVICHKNGKYNLNSKFGKAIQANGVVFESKRLYENQIPNWIQDYLRNKKLSIRPEASALVAEYLGTELSRVANELDKMAINLAPGTEITTKHIEEQIGISKDYNVFELQKALGQRDVLKANRIANYFAANPKRNPITVIISSLYGFFSKVYLLNFFLQASEKEQLEALELRSAFFLKDYREATRYFNRSRAERAIALLREYDLKSKGVNYNSTGKPEVDLLREMIYLLLH
ncbi:DNA polymerase III subunit delta [Haliscomenobacter hydrossis]|uniref:DNA polymerase III, delta subunit n=1 Tax=Haliscomenobacter hydrossis (strain ATCC 27775 / DSM 1100 / LMG 10767 / O) TaxID=760192 RepID=F4KW10_HALH1|nr:DNA polymerase III subunit delta [Haliscomenobacter hydrossis]AEE48208.1 DNA polymerase III, delta subunit [Haliscomenobacter hydrossis DSM 1100]